MLGDCSLSRKGFSFFFIIKVYPKGIIVSKIFIIGHRSLEVHQASDHEFSSAHRMLVMFCFGGGKVDS